MASRVAEVVYRLKDLFSKPTKAIKGSYDRLRVASRKTADSVVTDNRRINKSFQTTNSVLEKFKGKIAALGQAYAGFAIARKTRQVADEIDRLGKLADRLDIDSSLLFAFGFAAEKAGSSVSTMEAALGTLNKRAGEAAQGIGRAGAALKTLGIDADFFISLDTEQQLLLLADAFKNLDETETKAAVTAQLFSKANADIQNVLDQGSAALSRQIEKGKEYVRVTADMAAAAAEFNDTISDADAAIEGLKFKAATPLIKGFNQLAGQLGLSSDELANIKAQIIDAQRRANIAEALGLDRFEDIANKQLFELSARLQEYYDVIESGKKREDARAASLKEQARLNKEFEGSVESLSKTYEEAQKSKKASLKAEENDLREARRKQAGIEKEFQALVDTITKPPKTDVSLADVFYADTKARAALARGEIEDSISFAREGADLLGMLQEKGTETDGTLGFLAKRLQQVAKEAAGQQVQAELIDVDKAQQGLDNVKAKFETFKKTAEEQGREAGEAFMAAMQAELSGTPLQAPNIEGLDALPDTVRPAILRVQQEMEAIGQGAGASFVQAVQKQVEQAEIAAPKIATPDLTPRTVNGVTQYGTDFLQVLNKTGGK